MKMGVGSKESELVELTMQCQKLGLERDNLNVLFDLNLPPATSAGKSVGFTTLIKIFAIIRFRAN